MFYDKQISLITVEEGITDNYGIYHPGTEEVLKSIYCDVQPYSSDLLRKDYGYDEQVTKRVFCDVDQVIKNGMTIKYNNERYIIKKIIPWDDYWELMIDNE